MFRLYFTVFWNKESVYQSHHGEGTASMKIPLVILTVCTIFTGFVPFASFVTADRTVAESHVNLMFSIIPVAIALLGILLASLLYRKENNKADRIANSLGGLYNATYKKFYIDEIYLFITKKIIFNFIGRPAAWIDRNIVDGFMNLLAHTTGRISDAIKALQSGKIQNYTLLFFAGVAGLAIIFIYIVK
jgi:NADH-quinone oxidoreductase subunit L